MKPRLAPPGVAPAGRALPVAERRRAEGVLRQDLGRVQVHPNSPLAQAHGAEAFTESEHIHFAPGAFAPGTGPFRDLLGHELAHVAQQRLGLRATGRKNGSAVAVHPALERQADAVGVRTAGPTSAPTSQGGAVPTQPVPAPVVQLRPIRFRSGEQIDTLDHTEDQLHEMFVQHVAHDLPAAEHLDAAIDGGEHIGGSRGDPHREVASHMGLRLPGAQSLEDWYGSHEELAGSHHKFPKRSFAWLHSNMTEEQQETLNRKLFLPRGSGPKGLARLRSNLIPWGPEKVASDRRRDDPEHTGESVDIVRDETGAMSPRSSRYSRLAHKTDAIKKRIDRDGGKLTDREASDVGEHLHQAELLHDALERDPTMPADYGPKFWGPSGDKQRPFKKTPVRRVKSPVPVDPVRYQERKLQELKEQQLRGNEVREHLREQERAPHHGAAAFMGHSERLGQATMGRRPAPMKGSLGWAVSHGTTQVHNDLLSAVHFAKGSGDQWKDDHIQQVLAASPELTLHHEQMRVAQHEAWRLGDPNAHQVGRRDYDEHVNQVAGSLAKQLWKG